MDGYISCSNNSRLFGGNRRVTGLLAEAVIATMAEQTKKITPLTEKKTSQIEKIRKRTLQCRPHHLIESQSLGNEAQKTHSNKHLTMKMEMRKKGDVAVEVGNMDKSYQRYQYILWFSTLFYRNAVHNCL